MVALETVIELSGITGKEITDFFLRCDDEQYREWWPGTHRIEAGLRGAGRIFDPLLRRHLLGTHAAAMEEHARTEFPKLRDMLLRKKGRDAPLISPSNPDTA